ncbi:permease protein of ABC transporter [Halalkalibacter wakoensis JCM 9140]|uniref:Permease protein of ABC transporter n=1 Tax=Halalkalibacter wakoensis JCM 9140 TaxID=1236970 RepID=W4Q038_9BACI|nr:ABC transporter permease [Halalkalibacter wakoensis]GAE25411.1 permease protein of ABC transporter [Halalkalibacter wakoensis JCM 9140]
MTGKPVEKNMNWVSEPIVKEKKIPKPSANPFSSKSKINQKGVAQVLLPLGAGLLFITLWQLQVFHMVFQLRTYQLPLPSAILTAIIENIHVLLPYTGYTLTEAVSGMLLGSTLGFLLALVATAFPRWGKGGLFIVVALNAVPIVALAPIMNLWFGSGIGSRIAIVTIITMAAMAINAHKGMTNVHPLNLDLMHSYAASKVSVFRYVRIAHSMPNVFTALKINTTASMIGAIVGEFFFSSRGLGYLLSNSVKVAQMPLGWACIVVAALVGVLFYTVVERLEKVFLRWHPSKRV